MWNSLPVLPTSFIFERWICFEVRAETISSEMFVCSNYNTSHLSKLNTISVTFSLIYGASFSFYPSSFFFLSIFSFFFLFYFFCFLFFCLLFVCFREIVWGVVCCFCVLFCILVVVCLFDLLLLLWFVFCLFLCFCLLLFLNREYVII